MYRQHAVPRWRLKGVTGMMLKVEEELDLFDALNIRIKWVWYELSEWYYATVYDLSEWY